MSKRKVSYIKPQDPSFLAKLKQQIGYKEGPTIETKKQKLEDLVDDNECCEDRPEREDEKPQVVVLNSGDLTAEQAADEEKRLAKVAAEAPADLNQRIIFQRKKPKGDQSIGKAVETESKKVHNKKATAKTTTTTKLSFNVEDEDE